MNELRGFLESEYSNRPISPDASTSIVIPYELGAKYQVIEPDKSMEVSVLDICAEVDAGVFTVAKPELESNRRIPTAEYWALGSMTTELGPQRQGVQRLHSLLLTPSIVCAELHGSMDPTHYTTLDYFGYIRPVRSSEEDDRPGLTIVMPRIAHNALSRIAVMKVPI